jgi:hypothetical protein
MRESAMELLQQNEALRQRLARLSAAVLRINASLDPDAVLAGKSSIARVP